METIIPRTFKLPKHSFFLFGPRGTVVKKTLHPFLAFELGKKFNLNNALTYGLLPLVISSHDVSDVLKTYVALYIREEVQMEGLVRNIGNFSRFLEAISFSHGSLLNISNVARECEIERKIEAVRPTG